MSLTFEFVLTLAIVYGTSFLFRFLNDYGFPILVVEIVAGIVFGSILGIVGPDSPGFAFVVNLAAFGLLMVMFDAGLELDLETIRGNPRRIGMLAVPTFFLPFLSGVGFALALGLPMFAAFLVGVTVSTTSLGLVYPLLDHFGVLDTNVGQFLLSTTVMNDVLSVAALAYGLTLMTAPRPIVGVILVTVALGVFLVLVPFVFEEHIGSIWVREDLFANPIKIGVFIMVALAFTMELIGIHAILGAFFAGLLIATLTREGHRIEESLTPVTNLTAPVFFFYIGMNFSVEEALSTGPLLLAGVVLLGLGSKVVGGVLGGWIAGLDGRTTVLLASVIPGRLSISVAAAEIGRSRGIISPELYNAFVILSVLSVFVAVIAFRYFIRRQAPSNIFPVVTQQED